LGGTTTLVFDTATGRLDRQFLSLAGTQRNCAGGPTPWGSWISCEETTEGSHGYNFEVPAHPNVHLVDPVPLTAMGRFNHEAVAVDPASGIVYQTEDRENGLIYRFIPHQPGQLQQGGRLQALRFLDQPGMDARNWETQMVLPGERFAVDWVDLEDVESPEDELRLQGFYAKGAARFARTEGMWHDRQMVYFACTNGGLSRKGQIWRYYPSPYEGGPGEAVYPGWVELFLEPNDSSLLENADNLTVAPWGDLIVCEDDILQLKPLPGDLLVGITPDGQIYKLARSFISELCGSTFSPDGSTLFVNIYDPGMTLAITGPWRSVPPEPVWI
jgi:secreted PhoX family phosphatase